MDNSFAPRGKFGIEYQLNPFNIPPTKKGLFAMVNLIILSAYLLVMILIGVVTGRKVKNLTDFAAAGKNYGTFVIFATLSASFIGGGVFYR